MGPANATVGLGSDGVVRLARRRVDLVGGLLALALLALAGATVSHTTSSAGLSSSRSGVRQIQNAYGKLPLAFVPNKGQTDGRVRYYAEGPGFGFYFTNHKAVLAFEKGDRGQALELRFLGANPNAQPTAADRGDGRVTYLVNSKHQNLPSYHELAYRDLWPGVDMVFRGAGEKLNYEFYLRPGADPSDIRLAYRGTDGLSLGAGGNLLVKTPFGTLQDSPPRSYQRLDGRRIPVGSRFVLDSGGSFRFQLGPSYDPRRPLVIDPGLAYSTYLGGAGDEEVDAVAVDSSGNAYATGKTSSVDFPTTAGAFDTSSNGATDVFVTKLNAGGSALVYSTYLGAAGDEKGASIAVDSSGNAYVTGKTNSAGFPTTAGAFHTTLGGTDDGFVTKLNSTGSALVYTTFLGGSAIDEGTGIALDSSGNAYVTGVGNSTDFPTTAGVFDTTANGSYDAFVSKLNASGSALAYSTYLGGSTDEQGYGIAVDASGSAYVIGRTDSSNFPVSAGAFDSTSNAFLDVFVSKLNATGSALAYSTYLGGKGNDRAGGIAVDSSGNAYVTGYTSSADFPTTSGALDTSLNGNRDAYATKLNATGTGLTYSTYLGGSGEDRGAAIKVDSGGSAYVAGLTGSSDFPATAGAFDTSYNGGVSDAYGTKLNAAGTAIADSTYLGGSGDDEAMGLALDPNGSAYLAGTLTSSNFPVTVGAYDTTLGGTSDAFVVKLGSVGPTCNGKPATIVGTSAGETLTGTAANDVIVGQGGNDSISGGGGNDTICGGDGNDKIDGGAGADFLSGEAGIDSATYATRTTAVTVDLDNVADDGNSNDGPAGARDNVRSDVETLIGGSGADTLTGSATANTLDGRNGADVLSGLGGIDIATYATRTSGVTVSIDGNANDGNSADGSADNVKTDVENLVGGSGADTLTGSASNNRLTGGLGADSLFGLGGNDALFANDGTADTTIDCDGGTADIAHVDSHDPGTVGCETVGP
jgi:Ca2+-binding RTX toxin-like protein